MDWSIQLYYNKLVDRLFISQFFKFLVIDGVRYNAYKYKARYAINATYPEKDIEFTETEIKDSTSKLNEIVNTYLNYNLKTTHFSIDLDYMENVKFNFSLYIIPVEDGYIFSFDTGDCHIPDEKTFLTFVNLCKEIFVKFQFAYGSFKGKDQFIPTTVNSFLETPPDIVTFYSKSIVDRIGSKRLLSAPVRMVESLENGNVMLLVCTNPVGCPDEVWRLWHHLGYR